MAFNIECFNQTLKNYVHIDPCRPIFKIINDEALVQIKCI